MALSDPARLLEASGEGVQDSPTTSGELTHVSEVLAESGIPVADSLKAAMFDELMRLALEDAEAVYEEKPRRSA